MSTAVWKYTRTKKLTKQASSNQEPLYKMIVATEGAAWRSCSQPHPHSFGTHLHTHCLACAPCIPALLFVYRFKGCGHVGVLADSYAN